MSSTYLIALGSNRRHHLYGRPQDVVLAAMEECAAFGTVTAHSPVIATPPMGAAQRRFANGALVLSSELTPTALLAALKHTERAFGRRPGQRWGDRVLDIATELQSLPRWQVAWRMALVRALPARLAVYIAASARLISSSAVVPSSGASA